MSRRCAELCFVCVVYVHVGKSAIRNRCIFNKVYKEESKKRSEHSQVVGSIRQEQLWRKSGRQEFLKLYGRLLEEDGVRRSESTVGMFDFDKLDDIFGSKRIDGFKRIEEDFKDDAKLNRHVVYTCNIRTRLLDECEVSLGFDNVYFSHSFEPLIPIRFKRN